MQKLAAHTSIWLGKRESDFFFFWNVWCSKSQRLTLHVEISKISSTNLKKRCIIQKGSNVLFMQKPNEKLLWFVIILLWEVIYAHFYNWNSPFDFVLVVYDLIELIIETSLWSKDYSTLDPHTQQTSLMFNECLFHLCNGTCLNVMCVCSTICGSNQKDFLFFLFAFGCYLYHPCFSKFSKLFLCEKLIFWVFLWPISCISSTGN